MGMSDNQWIKIAHLNYHTNYRWFIEIVDSQIIPITYAEYFISIFNKALKLFKRNDTK